MNATRANKSHSTNRRAELAARLLRHGVAATVTCSHCAESESPCVFAKESHRCSECVRRGRSCDGSFSGVEFDLLEREKEKLQLDLRAVLVQQAEAAQKAVNLEQQISSLGNQHKQRLARGAAPLQALDEAEEASRVGQGSSRPNAEPSSASSLEQLLAGVFEDPFPWKDFGAGTRQGAQIRG